MTSEVCAAIVTYQPNADLEHSVRLLRPQVERLVVVDNHSDPGKLEHLRSLATIFNFSLIENPENFGIGTALNQSIEWAEKHANCECILFLDQDSLVSENFVSAMFDEYKKYSENQRIFLVMPNIIHRRTGARYRHYTHRGKYLVSQTSGSLVPLRVFADVGLYREDLFIDYVDYEFCLRAVSQGWSIALCESAVLVHDPGNANQFSLLGIKRITATNYTPLRKYYAMRNGIYTIGKYRRIYPAWAAAHAWVMLKGIVRMLLFEQQRARTVLMWSRAIRDVVRSRFGRYPTAMNA